MSKSEIHIGLDSKDFFMAMNDQTEQIKSEPSVLHRAEVFGNGKTLKRISDDYTVQLWFEEPGDDIFYIILKPKGSG